MEIIETIKQKLNEPEYNFFNTNEHLKNKLVFLTVGGSYAYGTNVEISDIDIRGCCLNSKTDLLGLTNFEQVVDNITDTTIYSINKLFPLLINCNPNTIELLGNKIEYYFYITSIGTLLLGNKHLFLSQKCVNSFGGYAFAQLNRLVNALGRNKQTQSSLEENLLRSLQMQMLNYNERYKEFPQGSFNLYIDESDKAEYDTEVFCDISLKHYPLRDFNGLIKEHNEIVKTYGKLNHRNTKKDELHLCKHAMHLIRLYMMGIDILEKEEINTYREGKDHDLLMSIRNGEYLTSEGKFNSSFDDLLNEYKNRFDYASKNTSLPNKPNMKQIEELLITINEETLKNE